MTAIYNKLLKLHLTLVILLVLNFICQLNLETSLNRNIAFILKIIFYVSGIILFFMTFKLFKKWSIYFSLYLISPIFIFISWLIDGIFGAILGSIFLFLFAPSENLYQFENVKIYKKFGGFLGRCCDYEFTKDELFIFERKVAELNFENIDFKKVPMKIEKDTLYLPFILKEYDDEGFDYPKDSIIKLCIK